MALVQFFKLTPKMTVLAITLALLMPHSNIAHVDYYPIGGLLLNYLRHTEGGMLIMFLILFPPYLIIVFLLLAFCRFFLKKLRE